MYFLHQLSIALKTSLLSCQARAILSDLIESLVAQAVTASKTSSSTATAIRTLGEILFSEKIGGESENFGNQIKRKRPTEDYIPLLPEDHTGNKPTLLVLFPHAIKFLIVSATCSLYFV